MTIQAPKTVQYARLSREAALDALTVLHIQQATHAAVCRACYEAEKAKRQGAQRWASWVKCDHSRALLATENALRHRLYYLKQAAIKEAARAHGLTPWQFQHQQPDEYEQIAAHFRVGEE